MRSVSQTVNVQVETSVHDVFIYTLDTIREVHVSSKYLFNGVLYEGAPANIRDVPSGTYTIEMVQPDHTFEMWDSSVNAVFANPNANPTTVTITGNTSLRALIHELVETALTISAPSSVEPGANISFTGRLTRPDTGAGLAGKTISLEHPPGTTAKTGTTDTNGNYTITVNAPTVEGTYQYRTSFAGNSVFGSVFSRTLGLGVGVLPAWVIPVGVLALGITLIGVSNMKKLF